MPAQGASSDGVDQSIVRLISNLPGVVYRCLNDLSWTMKFISDNIYTLTGYRSDELIDNRRLSYGDLIHDDDRGSIWSSIQEKVAEGKHFEIIYRIITAGGGQKWVWEKGHAVSNDKGQVIELEGFIQDITKQKQIEEKLLKDEALLNEVGSITKIGGWEMDLISGKAKWTRGTHEIVEIEPDGPIPGPDEHVSYYLPEYRPLVEESMRRLIEEDSPLEFEAQLKTAKGNIKWCRAQGRGIREGGKCVKVFGTFQDITERKEAEEALRESEQRYRTIVDGAMDGITLFDETGRILKSNEAYCRMIGYSEKELQGMSWSDIDVLESPDETKEHIEQILSTGGERFDTRHKRKNGTLLDIEVHVRPFDPDNKTFVNFIRDITERKQAEETLRESEKRFRSIFESDITGALFWDINGEIAEANDMFLNIIGYSREDLLSGELKWTELTPPEFAELDKVALKQLTDDGAITPFEKEYIHKNGKRIPILLSAATLPGESTSGIAFVLDITELKQAENELKKYRDELEKMVEERTRELKKRNEELERMHELFVGREFRIKELRDRVRDLEDKLKIEC